ncbi:hypothetical protein HD553DRAFT_346791 [Filobasidium floriforme]|uniref:uncharacterized protein n=1 Tax=Filobasidium floriforme TaxID=5210 RepID=UPI001E8E0181|nr:uncharacterized protein HD553DRAFT_346791 [Filobasidium floriforme]KAH8090260.1 hypothetical protein HD553DRAFT_346791 [Filobasidium floriforme]
MYFHSLTPIVPLLAALAPTTSAHGSHAPPILNAEGIDDRNYMQKHAQEEHHLTDFDVESFFHLHDLDRDHYLSPSEIEAIYGLHHPLHLSHSQKTNPNNPEYNKPQKEIPDSPAMESKRQIIVAKVLANLDTDKDGRVSIEEFVRGGWEGLPSFTGWGGLGHHYGSEEEYFLHHEELYHNTPETQTDESYTHPEDIEHFAEHEHIEAEEDAREREFEGLPSDAPLTEDRVVEDPLDAHAHGSQDDQAPGAQDQDQAAFRRPAGSNQGRPARIERTRPSTEDLGRLAKEAREQGTWGERDMHRPRNDRERMRKGTPYKYKMGRNNEF